MPAPYTPIRATLDELLQRVANPDLRTEQGRLDYRTLLLTKNARAVLDLPDLAEPDALALYSTVHQRLISLLDLELLRTDQVVGMMVELAALYAQWRPELLAQLPNRDPEDTADA